MKDNITNIVPISGDRASTAVLIRAAQTLADDSWRTVFVKTGAESSATLAYLAYLEKRFCLNIEVVTPSIPVDMIERRKRFIERRWPSLLRRERDAGWEMTLGLSGYLKALAYDAIREIAQSSGMRGAALDEHLRERCALDPDHLEMTASEQAAYLRNTVAAGVSPLPPLAPRDAPINTFADGWVWCPARAALTARGAADKVIAAINVLSRPALSPTPFLDACLIRGQFPSCHNPFCAQMRDAALLRQVIAPIRERGCDVRLWHSATTVPSHLRERTDVELFFPLEGWGREQIERLHAQYHVDLSPVQSGRCARCVYSDSSKDAGAGSDAALFALWEGVVSVASERGRESFTPCALPQEAPDWAKFPLGLPLFGACQP